MNATDNQIGRQFRRIQLGFRFLAHGARTQTTCHWTGPTPDQLATLRRRWMFNADERLRGPSPSSFEAFFASRRRRSQAALFLGICRILGAAPAKTGALAAKYLPSLENGERFCEAYEMYREWAPNAEFDIEQVQLLLLGAVHGESIELTLCHTCYGSLLVDKLGKTDSGCDHCRRRSSRSAGHALRS